MLNFLFWGASNGLGEVFEQASRGTKHLKGFRFGVGSGLSGFLIFLFICLWYGNFISVIFE